MRSARFPSKRRDRSKSIISRVVEDTYGLEDDEEGEINAMGKLQTNLEIYQVLA